MTFIINRARKKITFWICDPEQSAQTFRLLHLRYKPYHREQTNRFSATFIAFATFIINIVPKKLNFCTCDFDLSSSHKNTVVHFWTCNIDLSRARKQQFNCIFLFVAQTLAERAKIHLLIFQSRHWHRRAHKITVLVNFWISGFDISVLDLRPWP